MMTHEEIRELLSAANVILASARSRTKPGKLRVAIGDAQDYIYRARRALEAEKPLAEGESRIEVYGDSDRAALEEIWFLNRLGLKPGRHPVRVAIYAKEKGAS